MLKQADRARSRPCGVLQGTKQVYTYPCSVPQQAKPIKTEGFGVLATAVFAVFALFGGLNAGKQTVSDPFSTNKVWIEARSASFSKPTGCKPQATQAGERPFPSKPVVIKLLICYYVHASSKCRRPFIANDF